MMKFVHGNTRRFEWLTVRLRCQNKAKMPFCDVLPMIPNYTRLLVSLMKAIIFASWRRTYRYVTAQLNFWPSFLQARKMGLRCYMKTKRYGPLRRPCRYFLIVPQEIREIRLGERFKIRFIMPFTDILLQHLTCCQTNNYMIWGGLTRIQARNATFRSILVLVFTAS